jgi:hypothetical protein
MVKKVVSKGHTCNCGPGNVAWMLLAVIVLAVGFWVLIQGLQLQWGGAYWLTAMIWYAVGFLVLWLGKMAKWKCMNSCGSHKMG